MQAVHQRVLAMALGCFAVASSLAAQQPTVAPTQPPAQAPTQPAPQPAPQQGSASGDRQAVIEVLDVRDRPIADVVAYIAERSGTNILVEPGIEETVTVRLNNVDWRYALEAIAEQVKCVVVSKGPNILRVEKPPTVHFAFEKTDIQKVIDLIAKISGANIIVGPEVQGTITLRLKDVPWRNALEEAVKTLNFTVVEEDRGILRIVSPSSLTEQMISREIQLKYVRPQSIYIPYVKQSNYIFGTPRQQAVGDVEKTFSVLKALQNVLTDKGRLDYIERSNVLIVKDIKPVVDEISRMVERVDVEPGQVLVDVKFVTTSNSDILDFGVHIGDNGWTAAFGLGQIPHRLPFDLGAGGFEDDIIANDTGTGPFADPSLNFGATQIPDTIFGALNFTQVTAALKLLKKDTTTEIVQAPKIIALDHQEATIFVGDTIRFAEAEAEQGQAGGLQLSVKEAAGSPVQTGFQLLVTPHIIPGTQKVMLELIPTADSLSGTSTSTLAPAGFDVFTVGSGNANGSIALPRISSSTVATKMMLPSGRTAVIGGLTTETNTETETKVPLLGDIPILGWAFKNRATARTRSNLIIFVTIEIVRSPEETEAAIQKALEQKRKTMQGVRSKIFEDVQG